VATPLTLNDEGPVALRPRLAHGCALFHDCPAAAPGAHRRRVRRVWLCVAARFCARAV